MPMGLAVHHQSMPSLDMKVPQPMKPAPSPAQDPLEATSSRGSSLQDLAAGMINNYVVYNYVSTCVFDCVQCT